MYIIAAFSVYTLYIDCVYMIFIGIDFVFPMFLLCMDATMSKCGFSMPHEKISRRQIYGSGREFYVCLIFTGLQYLSI